MNAQNEEEHESRYVLRNILHTSKKRSDSEFWKVNVESLKEAGRKYKDNFFNGLVKNISTLTAREKCNLEYKSSDHIRRHLKRSATSASKGQWSGGAIKRTRQSQSAMSFDFRSDCIFCIIACDVKTDDRQPNRPSREKGMLSRTADREEVKKSVKEVILKVYLVTNKFFGQF